MYQYRGSGACVPFFVLPFWAVPFFAVPFWAALPAALDDDVIDRLLRRYHDARIAIAVKREKEV